MPESIIGYQRDAEDIPIHHSSKLKPLTHEMPPLGGCNVTLDSNGNPISVEPVDGQIHHWISETLKIFKNELQFKSITAFFQIEASHAYNAASFNQISICGDMA